MNGSEGQAVSIASVDLRLDGWANILSGLGMMGHDPKRHTTYLGAEVIPSETLANMYRTDGFARKIVDRPVFDMLREGFSVVVTEPGEAEGETNTAEAAGVVSYLDGINWKSQVGEFLQWDRLYGAALLIVGANDGGKLEDPLKSESIKTIEFLRVVDASSYDRTQDLETDAQSPRFGQPKTYKVNPNTAKEYTVHYSRAYELRGLKVPPNSGGTKAPNGAGDSVLQACFAALRGLGMTYSNTESIVDEFVVSVMTVKGLTGMVGTGRESVVLARLKLMDLARSLINTRLIDSDEKYDRTSTGVAGLSDILEREAERVSAVSGIPVRILMGKQSGGLNNTGDAETRDYYDHVDALREERAAPVLEWLTVLTFSAKDGPTKGSVPDDWALSFPPLWQMDDKEKAEVYKTMADGDAAYLDRGVLTSAEVATSRFTDDGYSLETSLMVPREIPEPDDGTGAGGDE